MSTVQHRELAGEDLHPPGVHADQHRSAGDDPLAPTDIGAAAAAHQHDAAYAALGHNHDNAYAAQGHNHDAAYAAQSHNHNAAYAPIVHNHDAVYAALGHQHDADYLPLPATPERGDLLYYGASGWTRLPHGNANQRLTSGGHGADPAWTDALRYLNLRVLEKDTAVTVADGIGGDFELPFAGTFTQIGAYVDTAGSSTGTFTIVVKLNGTSILSTPITIDAGEKSSRTSAVPPVLSTTTFTAGDVLTVQVTGVHATAAQGLSVRFAAKE